MTTDPAALDTAIRQAQHLLFAFDGKGFAARPEAVDYVDGIGEVSIQVEGLTVEDMLPFMFHPDEVALNWRPGIDGHVMDSVDLAIHYATQAMYQARLGQWPAMCITVSVEPKLAWSMTQLINVIEPKLLDLEQRVSEQEAIADHTPRPPCFGLIPPGTLPPPHPWKRGL